MTPPEVYLVDDDPAVLRGVARLVRAAGWMVSGHASAEAFLAEVPPDAVGCVVLDVAMPGTDGPALHKRLVDDDRLLETVFLTGHGTLAMGVEAMKVGATDFLVKPVDDDALLAAIAEAVRRSVQRQHERLEVESIRRRLEQLTPREREVMQWVVTGLLNKQIAAELGTAEKTVKVHRARVMEKMQARSLAELVRLADRVGLPSPAAGGRAGPA